MTYNEFLNKYNNQPIDFDGHYGYQCMDLYRQYVKEVLEFPQSPGVKGAVNVWGTYLKDHFTAIKNTPTGIPTKGDILIWDQGVGEFGHIAIFVAGDANSFTSFDQNWPLGSNCHYQLHNYQGVIGWLHPKEKESVTIDEMNDDQQRALGVLESYRKVRVRKGELQPEGNLEGLVNAVIGSDKVIDGKDQDIKKYLELYNQQLELNRTLMEEVMRDPQTAPIVEPTNPSEPLQEESKENQVVVLLKRLLELVTEFFGRLGSR
jgi:hypothetical protein